MNEIAVKLIFFYFKTGKCSRVNQHSNFVINENSRHNMADSADWVKGDYIKKTLYFN